MVSISRWHKIDSNSYLSFVPENLTENDEFEEAAIYERIQKNLTTVYT